MAAKNYGSGNSSIMTQTITAFTTASACAVSSECAFAGIIIKTDGTANVTLNVYASTAADNRKLIPTNTLINGSDRIFSINFSPPVHAERGVYVAITTTSIAAFGYQVIYDRG